MAGAVAQTKNKKEDEMTTTPKPEQRRLPASEEHKAKMRRIAREANARLGIPEKPSMTA